MCVHAEWWWDAIVQTHVCSTQPSMTALRPAAYAQPSYMCVADLLTEQPTHVLDCSV